MPLRALLFDLDGTLTESDPFHGAAYQQVLAARGVVIDRATYLERMSGRPNPDIVAEFVPGLGPDAAQALIDEKEARYRQLAGGLTPVAGLIELLAWARERSLKLGLVTNASRENVAFTLGALGLEGAFEVEVHPELVANPKPDPEPYRYALASLDVAPDEALAFEDSASGVQAAVAAGLRTVGLTTAQPAASLRVHGTVAEIPDFRHRELWSLLMGEGERVRR